MWEFMCVELLRVLEKESHDHADCATPLLAPALVVAETGEAGAVAEVDYTATYAFYRASCGR